MNYENEDNLFRRMKLESLMYKMISKKLITISGLSGTGKTAFIKHFFRNRVYKHFYHSLNLSSDLNYFISLLSHFLISVLENFAGENEFFNSFSGLTAKLNESTNETNQSNQIYIILDDYSVKDNSNFHSSFQMFINQSPPNIHFVVISEKKHAWSEIDNSIKKEIFEISNKQLNLDFHETEYYLNSFHSLTLDDDDINYIYDITDGWIIAIKSICMKIKSDQEFIKNIKNDLAYGVKQLPEVAVTVELFLSNQLDEEQRRLVCSMAIVEEFTEELAQILYGEEVNQIIEYLVVSCGLIDEINYEEKSRKKAYRFNKIWRADLYNKAKEYWSRKQIIRLHVKAGQYYSNIGLTDEALNNFIEVKDYHSIEGLLNSVGEDLFNRWPLVKLINVISTIPYSFLEKSPWFQYIYAYSQRFKNPEMSYYYANRAMEGFLKSENTKLFLRALFIKAEAMMFFTGGLSNMNDLLNIKELNKKSEFGDENKLNNYYKIYAGWSHCYLTGDFSEAVRLGEEVRRNAIIEGDINLLIWTCWILTVALTYMGSFELAKGYINQAIEKLENPDVDPPLTMMIPFLAGFNATLSGELNLAIKWLEMASERAKKLELEIFDFYIFNYVAYANEQLGDFKKAEYSLERMKSVAMIYLKEDNYHLKSFLLEAQAQFNYYTQRTHKALPLVEESLRMRKESKGEIYFIRLYLLRGAILRETHYYTDSLQNFDESINRSLRVKSKFFEASTDLQIALTYLKTGNNLAIDFINKAIDIAQEHQFNLFYGLRKEDIKYLIEIHEKDSFQKRFFEGLYDGEESVKDSENLNQKKSSISVNEKFYLNKALNLYYLGRFIVKKEAIELEDLPGRKVLYLLKLLGISDRPISIESIIFEMWQDYEERSAMNNFNYTLHQLRKYIGLEDFIINKNNYCQLNPKMYATDVNLFNALVTQYKKLSQGSKKNIELLDLLNQALILYRSDFLYGEDLGSKLILKKEEMSKSHYQILVDKARLLMANNMIDEAIMTAEKAIDNPFSSEEVYRLLMVAYYIKGESKKAVSTYMELKVNLENEMGVLPHKETNDILARIRASEDSLSIMNLLFNQNID